MKNKRLEPPKNSAYFHEIFSSSLLLALEKSLLDNEVKKHCKLALAVISIILTSSQYNSGTGLLLRKEFDPFFALFPDAYYTNRDLICLYSVSQNIQSCISNNKVIAFPELHE